MEQYAKFELDARLNRVREEWRRAAAKPDDEAIHDLRVAIRRLSQGYRVLGIEAGDDGYKATRKLRQIRRLAGEVRDCDVAIDLLQKAGLAEDAPPVVSLRERRQRTNARLAKSLAKGVPV